MLIAILRYLVPTVTLLPSWSFGGTELINFNNDGAWCWFQDERAIIYKGKLIVGSVAAGADDPLRRGDVEAVIYDLSTEEKNLIELHDRLTEMSGAYDDHNTPAFLVRPDGLVLAVYSRHGPDPHFFYRITQDPNDLTHWTEERKFLMSPATRLTYSNLHLLQGENEGRGRTYNFFRGLGGTIKPSYAFSDDGGDNWTKGNIVIEVPGQALHRPYVKYTSNGTDTIHLLYTEGHPDVYANSVYHIFYRDGYLHRSDGTRIGSLSEGLNRPEEGTLIYHGNEEHRAWTSDIQLDDEGKPYAAFSIRVDPDHMPLGTGGLDHRYHYARWTGSEWVQQEIAYGGSRLYWWQDDYTGNITLDPDDPNSVYISTDVDPSSGEPLKSKSDGGRHFEIYRGLRDHSGLSWDWIPVTSNSSLDNIRPILPKWDRHNTALLWLRGTYRTYTNYDLDIVGLIKKENAEVASH